MPYETPSWFAESTLEESSCLQAYFDSIEVLDPLRGYNERNVDWFEAHILPDLLDAKARLNLGPTLLDVGCGYGYFTRRLAAHFPYLVGIDFSEARINGAKRYNAADNIDYLVLDVTCKRLESRDGCLSAGNGTGQGCWLHSAISSAVIQHVPPKRRLAAFENVAAAVASGGYFLLYDECSDDRPENWDGFYEAVSPEWMRSTLADFWQLINEDFVATGLNGERIYRFELRKR